MLNKNQHMKVTFHFNDSKYTIEINDTQKVSDLKNKIIQTINDNTIKYIDLKFICENPIRSFGKHTINPGIFARIWDSMILDNYPLKSKNLRIEIIPVDNYLQQRLKRKNLKRFKFGQKNEQKQPEKKTIVFDYDIDFPPIGS